MKLKIEKDFVEAVEVKSVSEIKQTYDAAVKNNKPQYRCKSVNGAIFGWDEKENKHIRKGDEDKVPWFDNPHYIAPTIATEMETSNEPEKLSDKSIESIQPDPSEPRKIEPITEGNNNELKEKIVSLEKRVELLEQRDRGLIDTVVNYLIKEKDYADSNKKES